MFVLLPHSYSLAPRLPTSLSSSRVGEHFVSHTLPVPLSPLPSLTMRPGLSRTLAPLYSATCTSGPSHRPLAPEPLLQVSVVLRFLSSTLSCMHAFDLDSRFFFAPLIRSFSSFSPRLSLLASHTRAGRRGNKPESPIHSSAPCPPMRALPLGE
jgi:hypothetical protein